MKTAIVTDSTAYIPKEVREKHEIYMIPLSVNFGNESFREEVDMTADQYWQEIKVREELPTTSQPPIGEFVELFEKLSKDYDAVISIHLSSSISGTFNGAASAGQMVEGIKVYPFDSEISCMPQGFYAIEAAEMVRDGKSPEQVIERLEQLKNSLRAYFMVDDLSHLKRGGRLSGAQAFIGSLLQIKPILQFENKVIIPLEKIRTRKKAINRLIELFDEEASKGIPLRATVIHANRPEDAKKLIEQLSEKYPNVEFYMSYFGAVIGTHLGEGALGLGWLKK
ncbi:DegV family protein [Bacillus sp. FJAT-47783]|uniref:DegV family protein n=1 Tax=Bacillus sp. FJAT-47783 TaxID=2922712 RepID=UPI001FAB901B|nr:DegV family protein [Bacillus sp. FJAT-47783]